MTNDDFGKGIFDDDINDDAMAATTTVEPEVTDEPETTLLAGRALALARDEDPDKVSEEPAASDVETEPETTKPRRWSASDKRLASMYDLTDEDLKNFDSPSSLLAAIDLLEARKENAETEAAGSSAENGSSDADTVGGAVSDILGFEKTDVEDAKEKYNALDDDGERIYDEATAEILINSAEHDRKLEDALERSLQQGQSQVEDAQQAELNENVRQFNAALDEVPGMYGSGSDLSPAQNDARLQVGEHVELLYQGYMAKGGKIPPLSELVERSVQAVHSKEYAEAQRRVEALKEHSAKRRSPGSKVSTAPSRSEDYDPESAAEIAKRPALQKLWEAAQLEN